MLARLSSPDGLAIIGSTGNDKPPAPIRVYGFRCEAHHQQGTLNLGTVDPSKNPIIRH